MSSSDENSEQKRHNTMKSQESHPKKAYHSPQLLIYGDIREITQNLGPMGMMDGAMGMGTMGMRRTGF